MCILLDICRPYGGDGVFVWLTTVCIDMSVEYSAANIEVLPTQQKGHLADLQEKPTVVGLPYHLPENQLFSHGLFDQESL